MCLAVPGKVTEFYEAGGIAMARVDFGGVTREACMAYLPEAQPDLTDLTHLTDLTLFGHGRSL